MSVLCSQPFFHAPRRPQNQSLQVQEDSALPQHNSVLSNHLLRGICYYSLLYLPTKVQASKPLSFLENGMILSHKYWHL